MIRGVIFDLDGVLVSTDALHYRAWKHLADDLGIPDFTERDGARQRGVSRMESLAILLEKSPRTFSPEEKAAFAARKNGYYVDSLKALDASALLPGALETLRLLRDRGVRTAIGSASKNAPAIVEKTGLSGRFDALCSGLQVVKSKPDPEVFVKAADMLGLPYGRCLVVEDAKAGVVAAHRAGMTALGVGPEYAALGAEWSARDLSRVGNWDEMLGSRVP